MTVSYSIGPNPKWIIINNDGTTAGGARMFTYRSLNKTEQKIVYQDAGGTTPWTNPIIFDLNGVQGPFFWEIDDAHPEETYYIEVYEAPADGSGQDRGPLLWTMDDYLPDSGGGGGGDVTTYLPLTNYIANNQFIDHIDSQLVSSNQTNTVIAPSNHKGFTPALVNPQVQTYGVVGPDIRFIKNNTSLATDQITFPNFAFADAPLTGDVTPVEYVRYVCSGSPTGETYKAFQFPITQKVKNLSNTTVTFTVWAKVAAAAVDLNLYTLQYFGSGTGASAEVRDLQDTFSLTTTWTQFVTSFTVPDVAAKSLGTAGTQTGDDALYIHLEMPLNTNCDVWFTKPALYLGEIDPDLDFETYDQINSIDSTPRTGDIRVSLTTAAPLGWVAMNDGTIGSSGSGATNVAGTKAFQLYATLYTSVSNSWAPVSGGRTAPGNTMATAIADFKANKTLTLPRSLGRALAGAGAGAGLSTWELGEYFGEEDHVLTIAEMPAHTHPGSTYQGGLGVGADSLPEVTLRNFTGTQPVTVASQGGGGGHNTIQPTSFMNVFIKL